MTMLFLHGLRSCMPCSFVLLCCLSCVVTFSQGNKIPQKAKSQSESSAIIANSSSQSTANPIVVNPEKAFKAQLAQTLAAGFPQVSPQSFSSPITTGQKLTATRNAEKQRVDQAKEVVKQLEAKRKDKTRNDVDQGLKSDSRKKPRTYQDASIIRNSQLAIAQQPGGRYGQIPPPSNPNTGYSKMPTGPSGNYGMVPIRTGAWSDSRIPKQGNRYGEIPRQRWDGSQSSPAKAPNQYTKPHEPFGSNGYSKMPVAPSGAYGSIPKARSGAWSDSRIPKAGNRYGKVPPARQEGSRSSPAKAPNQYTKPHEPFGSNGYSKMPTGPAYYSLPSKRTSTASQSPRYGKLPLAPASSSSSANQYQKLTLKPPTASNSTSGYGPPPRPPKGTRVVTANRYDNAPPPRNQNNRINASSAANRPRSTMTTTNITQQRFQARMNGKVGAKGTRTAFKSSLKPGSPLKKSTTANQTKNQSKNAAKKASIKR